MFVHLLRRRFFVLACLITLIALFYAEENWRGKHAWQKYQQEQASERFELKELAPASVPDDQNFAMAPIVVESMSASLTNSSKLQNWYGDKVAQLGRTNLLNRLEMPLQLYEHDLEFTNKPGAWSNGEKFDLKSWQDYYRKLAAVTNAFRVPPQPQTPAKDVLLALSKYDAAIEELRVASKRPYSRFPVGYSDANPMAIVLPHLTLVKSWTIPVQLRAVAELGAGQSEKALEDVKLILRLSDSIRTEPIVISHLVRAAVFQLALQPIWEGLVEQRWKEAQLTALDGELAKLDFLADYQFAMRGELAFGVGGVEYLKTHRRDLDNTLEGSDGNPDREAGLAVNRFVPSGWFDQNKIAIARMHERYLLPIVNPETRIVSLVANQRTADALNGIKITPYNWFTRMLLPALNNVSKNSARAQSSADLARIAIALERYRLANGVFPETLEPLAPQFLTAIPHDVIDGKPLHYRRTHDGKFILYSVGWNGTDDDGKVVLGKGSSPSVDIKKGDWVWKFPAK